MNSLDKPIWGALAIAEAANLPGTDEEKEQKAFYLLQRKLIDADKCGNRYVTSPRRVLRSFGIQTP